MLCSAKLCIVMRRCITLHNKFNFYLRKEKLCAPLVGIAKERTNGKITAQSEKQKNMLRWGTSQGMGAFCSARPRKKRAKQAPLCGTNKQTERPSAEQPTCPLDGKPCDPECPDHFKDHPERGCVLTLAKEHGATVKPITPDGGDES